MTTLSNTNVELTDNVITDNKSWGECDDFQWWGQASGAGVCIRYVRNSNILIEENEISGNESYFDDGGGLAFLSILASDVVVFNNDVFNNHCYNNGNGGGLFLCEVETDPIIIQNNQIHGNTANNGSGMVLGSNELNGRLGCVCNIIDNFVYQNSSQWGGGIHINRWDPSNVFSGNCIQKWGHDLILAIRWYSCSTRLSQQG